MPRFHSGWEPPLDVLQEAPWEVEGLAAPGDEVRAPAAPSDPTSALRSLPALLAQPLLHTKPRRLLLHSRLR